jgi:hypothetical protein
MDMKFEGLSLIYPFSMSLQAQSSDDSATIPNHFSGAVAIPSLF